MSFLRLLLEWPGFATLSYSVIQCTAAVPLPGTWFLQESLFWENIIYFANIPDFLKTIRRIPMGFIGFSLKNHAKAYVSLSAANPRPPTTGWAGGCCRLEAYLGPESTHRCCRLVGQDAPKPSKTKLLGCLGPTGPHGGPHRGPGRHTPPGVPVTSDEARWPLSHDEAR